MKIDVRKHKYLVGFKGDGNVVFDKETPSGTGIAHPMTILQAIRELRTLEGEDKAVYKLVEVNPQKERLKQKILQQMVKK